jgi:hypothetical protein
MAAADAVETAPLNSTVATAPAEHLQFRSQEEGNMIFLLSREECESTYQLSAIGARIVPGFSRSLRCMQISGRRNRAKK